MNCPECHTRMKVYSTKPFDIDGNLNPNEPILIRRWRYCPGCHYKISTDENITETVIVSPAVTEEKNLYS